MSTVAVVGAGAVGGAVVQALAEGRRVSRIVLIDQAGPAAGKALDIQQAGAIIGGTARISATDDIAAAIGAAVCVVADRVDPDEGEWHGDDGFTLLSRLLPFTGEAPVILAGTTQHELVARAAAELRTPRHRILGSAPEALTSAIRAVVAAEVSCSPAEVGIAALGVPGGFVVPWDQATIAGFALTRTISQAQLARLEARVARLWPPGPFALGAAAAWLAEAMIGRSRSTFQAFTLLNGELGIRNQVGALPVRLGPTGVVAVTLPELSTRDRVRLQTVLGE